MHVGVQPDGVREASDEERLGPPLEVETVMTRGGITGEVSGEVTGEVTGEVPGVEAEEEGVRRA